MQQDYRPSGAKVSPDHSKHGIADRQLYTRISGVVSLAGDENSCVLCEIYWQRERVTDLQGSNSRLVLENRRLKDEHGFIDRIQREHEDWTDHNFPEDDATALVNGVLGMGEEVGELQHALLKQRQGIRGTFEEHDEAIKDSLGDVFIYMLKVARAKKWSLQDIILNTWADVSQRDWKKFPKNGLTE